MVATLAQGGQNLGSTRGYTYFYNDKGSLQQYVVEGGQP